MLFITVAFRRFISDVQHQVDPEGQRARNPTAKVIHRSEIIRVGSNERWGSDGHDKLNKIGFPLYAVTDFATGKVLGGWFAPSNRRGRVVAFMFLSLVEDLKGQVCFSWNVIHGWQWTQVSLLNSQPIVALRLLYFEVLWLLYGTYWSLKEQSQFNMTTYSDSALPDVDLADLPAHVYVRSLHNIVMESTWHRFKCEMGDNAVLDFMKGIEDGVYSDNDALRTNLE
jgi:hypothetical protein